jgi:hypothetical protein
VILGSKERVLLLLPVEIHVFSVIYGHAVTPKFVMAKGLYLNRLLNELAPGNPGALLVI